MCIIVRTKNLFYLHAICTKDARYLYFYLQYACAILVLLKIEMSVRGLPNAGKALLFFCPFPRAAGEEVRI